MIAHLVMFRPRADLTPAARRGLGDALTAALSSIPSIRRARVGRRITHGREYESLMRVDYTYLALLEFDDVAGLKAYLEDPVHQALGNTFFSVFEEALMYDFELAEGAEGVRSLVDGTS